MNAIRVVIGGLLLAGNFMVPTAARAAEEERFAGAVGRVARNYLMRGEVSTFLFRLDDAYFTTRYIAPNETAVASRGNKLMVLRYSVLNQDNHSVEFGPTTVQFAAKGKERAYTVCCAPMELVGQDNGELPPGSSKAGIVWFEVPSAEADMRLNVRVGSSPELGFDLRSQVRAAKGAFVDDKTGGILDELEVGTKQAAPVGLFDATVESVSVRNGQILDGFLPGSGDPYCLVQVKLVNQTRQPLSLETFSVTPELYDQQGKLIEWTRTMISPKSPKDYSTVLNSGQSDVVQYVFRPKSGQVARCVKLFDTTSGRRSICVKL